MDIEKLRLLESRIDAVLSQHTTVCAERDQLRQQLVDAEARLRAIGERLAEQDKERAEIKARVERILGRLDSLGLAEG
jgi:hypothetical protein